MSKIVEIQLNGKTFKLGYGLEVFMKLGELWGLDTLEEVNEKFQVLTKMGGKNGTSFKDLATISEIIEGMILGNPENTEKITALEIRAIPIAEFQEAVMSLTIGFASNMPQQNPEDLTEGKKTPPKTKKINR